MFFGQKDGIQQIFSLKKVPHGWHQHNIDRGSNLPVEMTTAGYNIKKFREFDEAQSFVSQNKEKFKFTHGSFHPTKQAYYIVFKRVENL